MLAGDLVELRPIDRGNIDTFLRWMNDPEVTVTLGVGVRPFTRTDEEAWLDRVTKQSDDHYAFQIHIASDGRLVGVCDLFGVDAKNRCAGIGIAIGEKDAWGKGYGTDAVAVLVGYAFDQLGMHRVDIETMARNERGLRSYAKVGFVEEGRRRQAWFRDGEFGDSIVMGILEDEWRAR